MSFRGVGFLSQARCFFLLPVFCTKLPAAASCLTNLRVNLLDKKANNLPEWQTIPLKVQFKLPTYKLLLPFCALYSTFLLFFFFICSLPLNLFPSFLSLFHISVACHQGKVPHWDSESPLCPSEGLASRQVCSRPQYQILSDILDAMGMQSTARTR